jgi:hypothetical protein
MVPSYGVGKWLRQNSLIAACWRAEDVTAELFAQLCSEHGLACIAQGLVNWENRSALIDCFSTFVRPHGPNLSHFDESTTIALCSKRAKSVSWRGLNRRVINAGG